MKHRWSTSATLILGILAIIESSSSVAAFNNLHNHHHHHHHRAIRRSIKFTSSSYCASSQSAAAYNTSSRRHSLTFHSATTAPNNNDGNSAEEESPASQQPADLQRRKTLFQSGLIGSLLPFFATQTTTNTANAATTSSTTTAVESPIADFPMRKLRLPKGGLGREYIILQLYIDKTGPYDFMVDSGLTTELITPHLQSILNAKSSGITKQGLSAGDAGSLQSLVELNNVELCCGDFFASGEALFPLQGPLHAMDQIGRAHV